LIDQDGVRFLILELVRGERAAFDESDAERVEQPVGGRDRLRPNELLCVAVLPDADRVASVIAGNGSGGSDGGDPGYGSHRINRPREQRRSGLDQIESVACRLDSQGEHRTCVEPEIGLLQREETANGQMRGGEQRQAQRHLADGQQLLDTVSGAPGRNGSPALEQRIDRPRSRDAKRRQ
jgi:hypothetical protein